MNVEGGGLFSLLSTKAMYGALCPAISTPIHEQEGLTGPIQWRPQRWLGDWSIFHKRKAWKSWDWSAWRREAWGCVTQMFKYLIGWTEGLFSGAQRQDAMGTIWKPWNSIWTQENTVLLWGWSNMLPRKVKIFNEELGMILSNEF